MATLYFGGIEKKATADILMNMKMSASGMMSQFQYSQQLLSDCGTIPMAMDSGAFSKVLTRQDIEKYAALIMANAARFEWFANADVIGDQAKSNENYTFLLSLLPRYLHESVLWIYQQSADRRYLYEGLNQHVRIGVGGLVPLCEENDKQYARGILQELASLISQYRVFPHYFGLSSVDLIKMLHDYHPDFSIDSTTWLVGAKYGRAINDKGQQVTANAGGLNFSKEEILMQNVRTMSKWIVRPAVLTERIAPYRQLSFGEVA